MQGYVQLLIANYQIIKQNEHTMKDVNHDALAKITHVIICDIIFDKQTEHFDTLTLLR